MRTHWVFLRFLAILALLAASQRPAFAFGPETMERADALFREGKFAEAAAQYQSIVEGHSSDCDAQLRLGEIDLLGNRLSQAEGRLMRVQRECPEQKQKADKVLAEVYYRRDEFAKAAPIQRALGRTAFADMLASFTEDRPYTLVSSKEETSVPFSVTDPLPVVSGTVNGGKEVNFLIDTGGGQLILHPRWADTAGSRRFGAEQHSYAGGKVATTEFGRVDAVRFGDFEVRNVPVTFLDTSKFKAAAGGKDIDGIIGTVFLYHFLSTIDYRNECLVLRARSARTDSPSKNAESIPFWMGGDHFVVAWGRIGSGEPRLFFVDTGLAGGGFTAPAATLKEAGIDASGPTYEGIGGGGPVKVVPFSVPEFWLGNTKKSNIAGFLGPFPEDLEYRMGFRIAGIISHAFFRRFALTLDFANMKLYLAN